MMVLLHSTQRLFVERIRYFDKWNSSVSDQLQNLRNKIEETKHLANGVNKIFLLELGTMMCLHVGAIFIQVYFTAHHRNRFRIEISTICAIRFTFCVHPFP